MSIVSRKSEGKKTEPVPAGNHHSVCYGVVDLGTQAPLNPTYKPARKLLYLWELPDERMEFEKDGVKKNLPRAISREFNISFGSDSKPSQLRQFLESWRGRAFTAAELEGFDHKNILGANCLLNVTHATKGDKTYANVTNASPLLKGMAKRQPENPLLFFTLSDFATADDVVWPDNLPQWVQDKIKKSEEWAGLLHGVSGDSGPVGQGADGEAGSEDIPF